MQFLCESAGPAGSTLAGSPACSLLWCFTALCWRSPKASPGIQGESLWRSTGVVTPDNLLASALNSMQDFFFHTDQKLYGSSHVDQAGRNKCKGHPDFSLVLRLSSSAKESWATVHGVCGVSQAISFHSWHENNLFCSISITYINNPNSKGKSRSFK